MSRHIKIKNKCEMYLPDGSKQATKNVIRLSEQQKIIDEASDKNI